MQIPSIDEGRFSEYLQRSDNETPFSEWLKKQEHPASIILAEGFEQRSLGILEHLASVNAQIPRLIIGRYVERSELNDRYRKRFEQLAQQIAPQRWDILDNHNDGLWIEEALALIDTSDIIIDITALSNIAIFRTLDIAALSNRNIFVTYSEAVEYWPKKIDWEQLKRDLSRIESIAEIVDTKPWLFSYEHKVVLIPGHEGYDSAGSGNALIGFLPFKCARLAAVLSEEVYSEMLFIAGRPHREENYWRFDALKEINLPIIKEWPVFEMSTFGYRNAIERFSTLLFSKDSMLERYDLHLAVMGSKLQTVACWIISSILQSVTVLTSIPAQYYSEAFSEGIGSSWVFKLTRPK